MGTAWEHELAIFLNELISVQGQLLAYLRQKRICLANADTAGLAALIPQGEQIQVQLERCLERRSQMLEKARKEGLPVDNLRALARSAGTSTVVSRQIAEATHNMRLVHIHNLTNWTLSQKALMHLAQLVEIIATGGQRAPTYEKRGIPTCDAVQGNLLDQSI